MGAVVVRGLVSGVHRVHGLIEGAARSPDRSPARVELALAEIRRLLQTADAALMSRGARAGDLAAPTRTAYGWLRFLAEPERLGDHVATVAVASAAARRGPPRLPWRRRAPRVRLYAMRPLFRAHRDGADWWLTIHEAFSGAPEPVLVAGVRAALGDRVDSRQFRDYTATPMFVETARQLAAAAGPGTAAGAGRHHDLRTSLERVTPLVPAGVEAGRGRSDGGPSDLPTGAPTVCWTSRRTRRKVGHFDVSTDTVAVSRSLDDARVPEVAIDYVMYHELLHRALGVRIANGRRIAHGGDFRRAERAFPRYAEARAFLDRLWDEIE